MCNITVLDLGHNNLDKIPVMSSEIKISLKVLLLKNNSLDNMEGTNFVLCLYKYK